jgi:hypothetical protein
MLSFWAVRPCRHQGFGETHCLHLQPLRLDVRALQGVALIMEAGNTSETSTNFYQTIRCNISEKSLYLLVLLYYYFK